MNVRLQVSELGRMVPQLSDPLFLLFQQLLLHLPQHFVHVFHNGPTLSLHSHLHMPPAILVVRMSAKLRKNQFIPSPAIWPLFGNRPPADEFTDSMVRATLQKLDQNREIRD
jgi:hypothetical protein